MSGSVVAVVDGEDVGAEVAFSMTVDDLSVLVTSTIVVVWDVIIVSLVVGEILSGVVIAGVSEIEVDSEV